MNQYEYKFLKTQIKGNYIYIYYIHLPTNNLVFQKYKYPLI